MQIARIAQFVVMEKCDVLRADTFRSAESGSSRSSSDCGSKTWSRRRRPFNEARALQALIKEAVGIQVLLMRSLFDDGILHRFLRRVSLAKPSSAPLRF
jgi:hypothetical protein